MGAIYCFYLRINCSCGTRLRISAVMAVTPEYGAEPSMKDGNEQSIPGGASGRFGWNF